MRGFDVPGSPSSRTSTSRSLNDGTTDVSSSGSAASTTTTHARRGDQRGARPAHEARERAVVARQQPPHQRGDSRAAGRAAREAAVRLSAGVSVSATTIAATDGQRVRQRQRLEEGAGAALHDRDRHDRQAGRSGSRSPSGCAPRATRRRRPARSTRRCPASRCWRSRRATFSAPTTASSITTAERHGETRERDRVEGLAHDVQHERRRDERHRDRHERDQHGPPLEQEGGERQRQQDRPRSRSRASGCRSRPR